MKILFTAPLRTIRPETVRSRERVVFMIAEAMVKRGHEVTILGTKDSDLPGGKIIPVIDTTFEDLPTFENPFYAQTSYLIRMAEKLVEIAPDYDIIHNHTYPEYFITMVADRIKTPMLTTVHALGTPELDAVLSLHKTDIIALSEAQKSLLPHAQILKVIYNGIDTEEFAFHEEKEDYLLWLGRLGKAKTPEGDWLDIKGARNAITLAEETGHRLFLSGKIEDQKFFVNDIKPRLTQKIQWLGNWQEGKPLGREEVIPLMQKAKAFLMPINWEDTCPLAPFESMSTGTPVLAYARGALPEQVEDGVTGFIVNQSPAMIRGDFVIKETGIAGLKKALAKVGELKSVDARKRVVDRFTVGRMMKDYEDTYQEVLAKGKP